MQYLYDNNSHFQVFFCNTVSLCIHRRLGMVLAVKPEDVDKTMEAIRKAGDTPYVVGRIEAGEKGVDLC